MMPTPSAVPVPDPGADPLAGLRGYRLPDPVAWWPPAPGWWVLAALLLVLGVAMAWWWLHRRRCNAAAREARRELARLRRDIGGEDAAAYVRRLSTLLRRYVLVRFPRREVAALTGDDWLAFLDAHGGAGRFLDGPGRQLVEAPYRRSLAEPIDPLIELVEDWIRHNRGGCR